MKLTSDLEQLKALISNASNFVSELNVTAEDGFLTVREITPDTSTMYEGSIEDVDIDGETFNVLINAQHFHKILKALGKANKVELQYDDGILNISSPNAKKKFTMPIYGDPRKKRDLPNIPTKLSGLISTKTLGDVLSAAKATHKDIPSIRFTHKNGELSVSSKYDNYSYNETIIDFEMGEKKEDASSMYGVEKLQQIVGSLLGKSVKIEMGDDKPLIVYDEDNEYVKQKFILAMRIDNQ